MQSWSLRRGRLVGLLILAALLLPSVPFLVSPSASAQSYIRIKNKWQNTYLYQSGAVVKYGTPVATDLTSQWEVLDFNGAKRLRNRSTGQYMHIENQLGYVQVGTVNDAWMSARWTVEAAPTAGYTIIRNVWQTSSIIHVENLTGNAQYGNIPTTHDSPQWLFEPVSAGATATATRTNTTGSVATATRTNTSPPTATASTGQTPYGGTARAIPGTIQAEDFDEGGAGVAYSDSDAGNTGAVYRTTDVDIEATADAGAGYNVGWMRANEWLEYTVNVQTAGNYTLVLRVASGVTTGSLRVEFGGVDTTGAVAVPNTGGWQTWQDLSRTVTLSAGTQIMRVFVVGNDVNLNYIRLTAVTASTNTPTRTSTSVGPTATRTNTPIGPTATRTRTNTTPPTPTSSGQTPYGGTARAIPGTIQAEDYDVGGEGVAYHDLETANQGTLYRPGEGVDIEASTDTGGGYNVGWTRTDEWLEYTVNVQSAGTYALVARVASGVTTGSLRFEFGGVDKTGAVAVPNTGGWQTWQDLSRNVTLSAGQQLMRIYVLGNDVNLNYVRLTAVTTSTSTPTRTNTATGPTSTPVPNGNLALNRPATADSSCAATEGPDKAVNGSVIGGNADKWCSLSATRWMQVDLGASFSLTRFVIKHAGAGGESSTLNTKDFNIQVSVDNIAWTTVVNVTGNTLNETSHLIAATNGRYVKLNVSAPTNTTDGAARIYEFEVYGTSTGPTSTPNPNNRPPAAPVITEPGFDGKVANPGDVHMETGFMSDPDAGDTHRCTDWEIWNSGQTERVWFTSCIGGVERVHTHLGDGVYQGSHAGRTSLLPDTDYVLRVRHRDSSNAANDWSPYAIRRFRTSTVTIGDPNQKWALRQAGYELEIVASNLQMPVNIVFKPNAGTAPGDPYYYVTELYGTIKVVKRDGSVGDFATGLLNYNPSGLFPGSGEQGLTGIVVDPATGNVYASMLYRAADGSNYPKVVRFTSSNGGLTAATQTTILDMVGEAQGQSHQVSNLTIGPDGKLYVHNGDGFDSTKGQDQNSFRGKILRMNLDGSPATDNPLYNAADGINAKDYIYAYGFRNPFGGTWRQSDGAHYELSNGPSVDRWSKVVAGRNYGYDGSDASMRNFAISSWPATGVVNGAFVQAGTFNGSGFPADKQGHLYMSHSGCTYCTGPGNKRVDEWVLNADGTLQSGPVNLLEYTGTGRATVVGLAAGPDGLYFTDFYADAGSTPTARGANVYRIRKLN